jgi:hypothetical protein
MKAIELNLTKDGHNCSCKTYKSRSHYKFIMRLGRCFPSTQAQAKYFITEKVCLDVLNGDDVEKVETILNKHEFKGDYKFTKSKTWVRLQNNSDLHKALKLEFNL